MASSEPTVTSSVLVPEILGFVPNFLLDDIINTANDAVGQSVDAMEVFLRRWAMEREEKVGGDWDSTQEVEQGLVAFQTLLNSHVDIAFDFLEVWSLRNIFAVPPNLPIVTPHQSGSILGHSPGKETELVEEIKDLRAKIRAQRKLQRLYNVAVRKSASQRVRSEKRLEKLSFLRSPQIQILLEMPDDLLAMYDAVSSLPPHDPSFTVDHPNTLRTEPGKRLWEANRIGYINWALEQLIARAKDHGQREGRSIGAPAASVMYRIGEAEEMKAAIGVMEGSLVEDKGNEGNGMELT